MIIIDALSQEVLVEYVAVFEELDEQQSVHEFDRELSGVSFGSIVRGLDVVDEGGVVVVVARSFAKQQFDVEVVELLDTFFLLFSQVLRCFLCEEVVEFVVFELVGEVLALFVDIDIDGTRLGDVVLVSSEFEEFFAEIDSGDIGVIEVVAPEFDSVYRPCDAVGRDAVLCALGGGSVVEVVLDFLCCLLEVVNRFVFSDDKDVNIRDSEVGVSFSFPVNFGFPFEVAFVE